MINGVECIQCVDCGKWAPVNSARRCKECSRIYWKKSRIKNQIDEPPQNGLYANCNNEQITAMLTGNVEMLLNAPVRNEAKEQDASE